MGLLNFMPGEWDMQGQGGLLGNKVNPMLQLGLGILANNSGNGGSLGGALGRGGLTAIQNIQEQQRDQMRNKMYELEMKKAESELKRQQEREQALPRLLQGESAYMQNQQVPVTSFQNVPMAPQEGAVAPNFGLQRQETTTMQEQPVFDNNKYMSDLVASGYGDTLLKAQLENRFKTKDPIKLGKGDRLIDPTNYSEVVGALPDPEEINPNKPFIVVDGKVVPNKAYQDYEIAKARAGAASNNISVNTGQKGFDNTLKLRGDFRSEPIYKAHQDVQSAYSQISTALKQNSPAGDLAGATKLMKILDPGSVVRESELGMAMAASGALDRLYNYADMVTRGTKLTPTQRQDFQVLADSLYAESANLYNAKRGEYEGIAQRNGLNTLDVLGEPDKFSPKPAKPAGAKPSRAPMKGQKVDGYKFLGGDPADPKNWKKL
jgi:hypothetical protein